MRLLIASLLLLTLLACKNKEATEADEPGSKVNTDAPYYSDKLPDNSPVVTRIYDSSKLEQVFPFLLYKDDTYLVAVEPSDTLVFAKFNPLFERHGYNGNGYSWDGIVQAILKKKQPALIQHVDFRSDAGGFYAFADGPKHQRQLATLLSETFNNLPELEIHIKEADRSKIKD